MGEDIRIFHIEIIYLIGGNITAVIVIILTKSTFAIMKKGSFLYSGSVSGLLENAKGCVWNCTVQNAEEARLLEANYSISSKQYVENGIHMKVLSKGKPNENCVLDNDITLEDAYIYLTNS